MAYECILYEKIGPVTRIWHNRPEQRNAENTRLLDELSDALKVAADDAEVRVVILGGKGKHFSSGHDLVDLGQDYLDLPTAERYAYEEKRFYGYALQIWDLPKPVIAQVQGACIAGGFMVAAMCDLMVAADDAFFSDPVVQLGSAGVEVLFHPWALGHRLAKDMLYTGRRMAAEEARACGLATRVVPRDQLEAATLELAETIAKAPPFAMKLTKRSINRTLDMQGLRTSLDAHFDTHQLVHTSRQSDEGTGPGALNAIKNRLGH